MCTPKTRSDVIPLTQNRIVRHSFLPEVNDRLFPYEGSVEIEPEETVTQQHLDLACTMLYFVKHPRFLCTLQTGVLFTHTGAFFIYAPASGTLA